MISRISIFVSLLYRGQSCRAIQQLVYLVYMWWSPNKWMSEQTLFSKGKWNMLYLYYLCLCFVQACANVFFSLLDCPEVSNGDPRMSVKSVVTFGLIVYLSHSLDDPSFSQTVPPIQHLDNSVSLVLFNPFCIFLIVWITLILFSVKLFCMFNPICFTW